MIGFWGGLLIGYLLGVLAFVVILYFAGRKVLRERHGTERQCGVTSAEGTRCKYYNGHPVKWGHWSWDHELIEPAQVCGIQLADARPCKWYRGHPEAWGHTGWSSG